MTIFIVRQTYAVVALFWRLCHDQLWEFAVFLSVHVSPTAWACSLCVWQVLPGRCWQSDQRGDEGEGRGAGCDDLPRWKWMIRRRRRTGEEDCGRLALACASLVRDYEASGGHKLTVALKTIWLRAACFLSIVLFFSSYLFFMDCCMNTLFLICNKPQYLGLIYSMADLSVKAPSLVVETLNGYFVLLSIHAYMFQTFDVMIWNTHQLLQVLRRNQTQKLKVKLQTILFLLTHDREWCIASSSTWFIKKSQRGTGKKEKPF